MEGSGSGRLTHLIVDERLNAAVAWVLVAFVAVVSVESYLDGDLLWVVFSIAVLALVVVPPVAYRSPRVMLPWEVLGLVSLPVLTRAVEAFPVSGDVATYLSVAALALVVAVELDVFTPVRMTNGFAVFFVVIVTMAASGVWAVVQWFSDLLLGTTFIYPEPVGVPAAATQEGVVGKVYWFSDLLLGTNFVPGDPVRVSKAAEAAALDALMWDFVAATAAGLLAGGIFVLYFRKRRDATIHLPDAVVEDVEEVIE